MLAVLIAHGAFFFIVGSTNVNLYSGLTFSNFIANTPEWIRGGIPLIIALCVAWSVNIVLSSCLGLAMRTFGSNPNLLSQLGKSSETYRTLGLALSNGAAGISGALTAQQNGYADVSMGFGVTLIGIATVLIGAHLIKNISGSNRLTTISSLAGCFLGAFIYFLFIRLLLISGISPLYLKSVFALVLGIGLYATSKKAPTTL